MRNAPFDQNWSPHVNSIARNSYGMKAGDLERNGTLELCLADIAHPQALTHGHGQTVYGLPMALL